MSRAVVVNACFGGFGLTLEAARAMAGWGCQEAADAVADYERRRLRGDLTEAERNRWYGHFSDLPRDDAHLIRAVRELGSKVVSGPYARLVIVEIPDDVDWHVEEYDGTEHVAEDHRVWGPE